MARDADYLKGIRVMARKPKLNVQGDQRKDLALLEKVAPNQRPELPSHLKLTIDQLNEVTRMASQRMTLDQIGVRLRIEDALWLVIVECNPDVRTAYRDGIASAQDRVSQAALHAATDGQDASMMRFWLERHGGEQWKPPKAEPTTVIVRSPLEAVDAAASTAAALERQRKLLDDTIEVEYVAVDGPAKA